MKASRKACLIRFKNSLSTRTHLLDKEVFSFGRSNEVDVICPAQSVSRVHLIVRMNGSEIFIEDQGSANGTWIDQSENPIEAKTPFRISPTMSIRLGDMEETMQFEIVDVPGELGDLEFQRNMMRLASHEALQEVLKEGRALLAAEKLELIEACSAQAKRMITAAETEIRDKKAAAERVAEKLASDAQQAATLAKAGAHREAELILEKARAKVLAEASAAESDLRLKSRQAALDAEAQARTIVARAEDDAAKRTAEAESDAKVKLLSADQIVQEATERATALEASASARVAEAVAQAKEAALRETEERAMRVLRDAEARARETEERARVRAEEADAATRILEDRLGELRSARAVLELENQTLQDQVRTAESSRSSAEERLSVLAVESKALEDRLVSSRSEFAEIDTARNQAIAQKQDAEVARAKASRDLVELQTRLSREAQELRDKALLEAEELKKSGVSAAASERLKAIEEVRSRMLEEEKQIQALRKHQEVQMTAQLEVLLLPLLKARFPDGDPSAFAGLSEEIQKTAARVLSGDNSTIVREIERVVKFEPEADERLRLVRIQKRIRLGAIGAVVIGFLIFGSDLSRWISSVVSGGGQSSSSVVAEAIIKEKRRKEKFEPPQIDVYQSSYTNNVLYMNGYTAARANPEFQKRWILGLNQLFVNELKLSENTIVEFSSAETALLRQLQVLREKADARTKDETIAKMHELERSETAKLKELLKGRDGYDRLRAFEQSELAAFKAAELPR